MKGAVVDRSVKPVASLHLPTPHADGPEAVVDAIADALLALTDMAAARGVTVRHAGVVAPGIVDEAVVVRAGTLCACGGTGCLETVASASAIATAYRTRTGRSVTGAADVATLVEAGDRAARAVWSSAADGLAEALAAVTTLVAPELNA